MMSEAKSYLCGACGSIDIRDAANPIRTISYAVWVKTYRPEINPDNGTLFWKVSDLPRVARKNGHKVWSIVGDEIRPGMRGEKIFLTKRIWPRPYMLRVEVCDLNGPDDHELYDEDGVA